MFLRLCPQHSRSDLSSTSQGGPVTLGHCPAAGSGPSSHTLPFRTSNSSPRQKSLCSLPNPLNKRRFAHTKGRKKGPLQSPQDKGAQRLWIQGFKKGQERKLRRAAWKGLRVFQIYQPPRQKRTAKPSRQNCSRTAGMAELLDREEGICNVRMFNSFRSPHLSKALGTQTRGRFNDRIVVQKTGKSRKRRRACFDTLPFIHTQCSQN